MLHDSHTSRALASAVLVSALATPCLAQKAQHAHKPVPQNQTKGRAQMSGGSGQFGTVYTLNNNFNFEILSAHYTVEPVAAYHSDMAPTDGKELVVDFAIKNVDPKDNTFNAEHFFNFVDQAGQLYTTSNIALTSRGVEDTDLRLHPGQGLGQPALHDPLHVSIELPAKARIVKIMLHAGRITPKEETFRYYIAGATKEEAGEAGNPKNVIAPLPDDVRDPADPSGSTPLDEGKGQMGVYVPSRYFGLRLDSFGYTTDPITGHAPDKGKKFAVATVTAKLLVDYHWGGREQLVHAASPDLDQLTDADGERYKRVAFLQARRPEDADHEFQLGDEYTFRVVFEVPSDAVGKKLVLGAREGRKWAYDVSNVK